MAPLSVVHFLCSGVSPMGVVVVVDRRAIDSFESGGLLALGCVDKEEDLINSLHKQSLAQ